MIVTVNGYVLDLPVIPHNIVFCADFIEALVREAEDIRPTDNRKDLWVLNSAGRWMSVSQLLVEFDYADDA